MLVPLLDNSFSLLIQLLPLAFSVQSINAGNPSFGNVALSASSGLLIASKASKSPTTKFVGSACLD